MSKRDVVETIAELIAAIGEEWFVRTLRASLQSLYQYDYKIVAHYHRGSSLSVLHSNFDRIETRLAVNWLERETYVLEPIYRLFAANAAPIGIYDMAYLVSRAAELPPCDVHPHQLPHLIEDKSEEMGWRTMNWPRHQQEICLIVNVGNDELLVVSLYNAGSEPIPEKKLRRAWPVLAAILVKHCDSPVGRRWRSRGRSAENEAHNVGVADTTQVQEFFREVLVVELTERERCVFAHLLHGETLPVIAGELSMSINTARTHRRNVYRRFDSAARLPELINRYHSWLEARVRAA